MSAPEEHCPGCGQEPAATIAAQPGFLALRRRCPGCGHETVTSLSVAELRRFIEQRRVPPRDSEEARARVLWLAERLGLIS